MQLISPIVFQLINLLRCNYVCVNEKAVQFRIGHMITHSLFVSVKLDKIFNGAAAQLADTSNSSYCVDTHLKEKSRKFEDFSLLKNNN